MIALLAVDCEKLNVYKDGAIYAEKASGSKKLAIWNGLLCCICEIDGDTAAMTKRYGDKYTAAANGLSRQAHDGKA